MSENVGATELSLAPPVESVKESRRRESMRFYGGVGMAEFVAQLARLSDNSSPAGEDGERTLKRWIEKGRMVTPSDLPPFQRPHELAAWWRRLKEAGVMKKAAPSWMVLLEQAGPRTAPEGKQTSTESPAAGESALPEDLPPDFDLPELDNQATAGEKQLQEFAQGWLAEMTSARKRKDNKAFYRAWNEYKALVKELRAWQKDRQRERLTSGEVLEAEKEREALGVIFGAINKTFTSALLQIVDRFAPQLEAMERRRIAMGFRDKIFAGLKATRFSEALADEQIAQLLAA